MNRAVVGRLRPAKKSSVVSYQFLKNGYPRPTGLR